MRLVSLLESYFTWRRVSLVEHVFIHVLALLQVQKAKGFEIAWSSLHIVVAMEASQRPRHVIKLAGHLQCAAILGTYRPRNLHIDKG